MPTGSGVWVAPIGTSPSDHAAWTELPVTRVGFTDPDGYGLPQRWVVGADRTRDTFKFKEADLRPYLDVVDQAVINMKRAADGYSIRQGTWSTGIDPAKWDAAIINKRSKPMALTKDHKYRNSVGHESLVTVERSYSGRDGETAYVFTGKHEQHDGRATGVYVTEADSIPLALNVLGYDRPDAGFPCDLGDTVVNGSRFSAPVPTTTGARDMNVAKAIDYLIGADIFDQRAVKGKADVAAAVKAAEIAAAKERVAVANREIAERLLRDAKVIYREAVNEAYQAATAPESAAKLQSALSSYETARRKFEGLPN